MFDRKYKCLHKKFLNFKFLNINKLYWNYYTNISHPIQIIFLNAKKKL